MSICQTTHLWNRKAVVDILGVHVLDDLISFAHESNVKCEVFERG